MTIRVSVPPELEGKIREQAAAAGKDLQTFALEALQERIAGCNGPSKAVEDLGSDRRVGEWLSWTASHPRLGYVVDDSRESIYGERGE